MLELTGESVILREFTGEHLHDPAYFAWLRDPRVFIPIYRVEYMLPVRFEQVQDYVHGLWNSGRDCLFAVHDRQDGRFVGTQRIGHIDWRAGHADMGVMIGDTSRWGRGLATQALRLACAYAFDVLCLRRLTGGTPSGNTAMARCFLRLGFVEEGRLRSHLLIGGRHEDHLLFGLLREDFKG